MELINNTERIWLSTTPRGRPSTMPRIRRLQPKIHPLNYLSQGSYPPGATKQDKCVIRKRSNNFQLIDGVLHYKGKGGLRQVKHFCHSSPVRPLHWKKNCGVDINVLPFNRDRTLLHLPYAGDVWGNDDRRCLERFHANCVGLSSTPDS